MSALAQNAACAPALRINCKHAAQPLQRQLSLEASRAAGISTRPAESAQKAKISQ